MAAASTAADTASAAAATAAAPSFRKPSVSYPSHNQKTAVKQNRPDNYNICNHEAASFFLFSFYYKARVNAAASLTSYSAA